MNSYNQFLESKRQLVGDFGFAPIFMPDQCYPVQEYLIDWAVKKGRAALFADCGMGKTLMQLAWAQNIVQKTNGRVLIMAPLAVASQTVIEASKFGIEATRSKGGELNGKIIVTNYERLHLFNPSDFEGMVCDESSILKSFEGTTKAAIIEFMRKSKYRLLCTATAAPNDFTELGNSSEALGHMGYMDMIGRFFKKADKTYSRKHETQAGTYYLKPHATKSCWQWIASWARAIRKPSDYGFDDGKFILPALEQVQHIVKATTLDPEHLFEMPAVGLDEQRKELARTCVERSEKAAEIANKEKDEAFVCWTNRNNEADLITKIVDGAQQVSGKDSDDEKEEKFRAFESGQIRVLVTKPKIAGFGLNWQHCARQTFFPSHSFEQYYQAIRRSWRFGQMRPVKIDVISTEGQSRVLANLQKKASDAEKMFESIIANMRNELKIGPREEPSKEIEIPEWMK